MRHTVSLISYIKVLKYVFFALILLLTINCLNYLFIPKDSFYFQSGNAPYYENENTNDVVFVGSSHVEWGIDPNFIWDIFGIPSINYAIPSMDLKNSYYLIKEVIKYQKPIVIVVDVFRIENVPDAVAITNRLSSVFPVSVNRIQMINSNEQLYDLNKRLDYYFPLNLYHSRKLDSSDYKFKYKNIERGHFINFDKIAGGHSHIENDSSVLLDSISRHYVERIIHLTRENNIKIVFIKTPNLRASSEFHKQWNAIKNIAKENDVQFINFNESRMFSEAGLVYNEDVANDSEINSHLNYYGAKKASRYIANILKNNFQLVDRRKEVGYAFLDSNLKLYKAYLLKTDPLQKPIRGNELKANEILLPDDCLFSKTNGNKLILQRDGNLALYDKNNQAPWQSYTMGKNAARCIMQLDGNLVLYDDSNKPLWASNTMGHSNSKLVLQDDGNLVIYDENHAPIWATNTESK